MDNAFLHNPSSQVPIEKETGIQFLLETVISQRAASLSKFIGEFSKLRAANKNMFKKEWSLNCALRGESRVGATSIRRVFYVHYFIAE